MKLKYTCYKCGRKDEIEADYFIPGVSGRLGMEDGSVRTYADPTEPRLCKLCFADMLEKINITGNQCPLTNNELINLEAELKGEN